MKIRVFQADKGDCLLVTGTDGVHMLVDGGMEPAFDAHVAPFLSDMATRGERIDLVYVSHIDQDHIAGVLKLLDNTMAWRVHEYRKKSGLSTKAPKVPQMPEVMAIWHNAFSMVLKENAQAAEDLLAQSSQVLALSTDQPWLDLASEHQELAYSIKEAIRVSRRIAADQLAIPLNADFNGALILVRDPPVATTLGGIAIQVIGPFAEDVDKLKDEWDAWLRKNKAVVAELRAKAKEDAAKIGQGTAGSLDIFLKQLGDRKMVTAPNLASVMLLVEEKGKTLLLTGDGHSSDVLKGLLHVGALAEGGTIHVDVLKFPHHGAEYNVDQTFFETVSADHYIFCGNGEHKNPDLRVVQMLLDTNEALRGNKKFKLWFNCSSTQVPAGRLRAHMTALEDLVVNHPHTVAGKVDVTFLDDSSFEFKV